LISIADYFRFHIVAIFDIIFGYAVFDACRCCHFAFALSLLFSPLRHITIASPPPFCRRIDAAIAAAAHYQRRAAMTRLFRCIFFAYFDIFAFFRYFFYLLPPLLLPPLIIATFPPIIFRHAAFAATPACHSPLSCRHTRSRCQHAATPLHYFTPFHIFIDRPRRHIFLRR
jgi:hypothetical protein